MFNCSRICRESLEMPLGRGRVCLKVDGESNFVTALHQAPPGVQRTLLMRVQFTADFVWVGLLREE